MKINDFLLRKISLSISVAGLLFLAIFLPAFSAKETLVQNISEHMLEQEVTVKGIVQNVQFKKNTALFEIADTEKIRAVKFSPTKQEIELLKAENYLEISGTVKKFRGKLEIVVKSVKKID